MFGRKKKVKRHGLEELAAEFSGTTIFLAFLFVLLLFFMLFLVSPYWA